MGATRKVNPESEQKGEQKELLKKAHQQWALNVLKRVKGGGKVTSRDIERATEILGAGMDDEGGDEETNHLATKADELLPRFARNQTELGSFLKVERKTIQRWRRESNFPKPAANGTWDVHAVRDWALSRGKTLESGDQDGEKYQLEIRRLKAICERLELGLEVESGSYIAKDDVYRQVAGMLGAVKSQLLRIPAMLAPQLVAIDDPIEMQQRLREEVDEAMRALHEDPWTTTAVSSVDMASDEE